MVRPGPVDRVRARARAELGPEVARQIPRGYQRLGRVLVVRLPAPLRPTFPRLGALYAEATGAETVLVHRGPATGEFREPDLERIAGGPTETEVVEHGTRYRFDAARLLFSRGNKTERAREAGLVSPGEQVVDLFAGIGYFTIPIARRHPTVRVEAVEANPLSFRYLRENLALNGVADRVKAHRGDNREVELPTGAADRVLLGYLPSSVPWIDRALGLLRPSGGTLHVHLVVGVDEGLAGAEARVRDALPHAERTGARLRGRIVKAYGPGRVHAVVDVGVGATPPSPGART